MFKLFQLVIQTHKLPMDVMPHYTQADCTVLHTVGSLEYYKPSSAQRSRDSLR